MATSRPRVLQFGKMPLPQLDAELARVSVPPTFKLNVDSAQAWIVSGFEKPR